MECYTYLIGWSKLDYWYYGCQFRKDCKPSDLWSKYFTSSDHVREMRIWHGEPDVVEIRKTFGNNVDYCRKWEHQVLRRLKVTSKSKWLNKSDNISIDVESMSRGGKLGGVNGSRLKKRNVRIGTKLSDETKQKLSEIRRNNPTLTFEARSKAGKISGKKAYETKTGIHAATKEQRSCWSAMSGTKTKGKIWIYNLESGKHKRINPSDKSKYPDWLPGYYNSSPLKGHTKHSSDIVKRIGDSNKGKKKNCSTKVRQDRAKFLKEYNKDREFSDLTRDRMKKAKQGTVACKDSFGKVHRVSREEFHRRSDLFGIAKKIS